MNLRVKAVLTTSLVVSLFVSAGSAQVRPATRHFVSSEECRFEFDYPSDWVILPGDAPSPCRVRLRPADFATRMKELDTDVYTLHVGVNDGNFLEVAWEEGFDFVRGQWVLLGRHSAKADAEVVSMGPWNGLRGFAIAGCYTAGGQYVGICEEPVLVLRDDDENVWSMRGGPQSEDAFDEILRTFRFQSK